MPDCAIDARPTTDATICHSCTETLRIALRALPSLIEDLTITLTRQARIGDRNGAPSTTQPLPYHPAASTTLQTIHHNLTHWATQVATNRGVRIDADLTDPTATSQWLLRWAGAAAQHPAAAELHNNIHAMTRAARRTIDLAAERRYVGPCDQCGADMYVGMRAETVHCPTPDCDATYPIAERRLWLLEQAYDRLLTASEMARAIPQLLGRPISAGLITKWAERGRIAKHAPHHRDPHHRPRYKVEDVINLARS